LRRLTGRQPESEVHYEVGDALGTAEPGSLEFFLLERYLLHARRGGTLWTVQVFHEPYPLLRARVLSLRDGLVPAAGFPPHITEPHTLYSPGVDVDVFLPRIRRIADSAV
jgi:uncharacterized protein YqjF (DUF2071 family)